MEISGFLGVIGLSVQGLGVTVLRFRIRVRGNQGFGSRASGFRFSGVRLRVEGLTLRVEVQDLHLGLRFGFTVKGLGIRASRLRLRFEGLWFRDSKFEAQDIRVQCSGFAVHSGSRD